MRILVTLLAFIFFSQVTARNIDPLTALKSLKEVPMDNNGKRKISSKFKKWKQRKRQPPPIKSDEDVTLVDGKKWKEATCKPYVFEQTYKLRGCDNTFKLKRNFCYGQCNTIIMPDKKINYSSSCMPVFRDATVTVKCKKGKRTFKTVKKYKKVVGCNCVRVEVNIDYFTKDSNRYNSYG